MAIDVAITQYGTQLLSAATATGSGAEIYLKRPVRNHMISIVITDADSSITALTVAIEHSMDNTTWHNVATHQFRASELAAKEKTFGIVNRPLLKVRANITVLTGAGAGDTIDVYYLGDVLL